VVGQRAGLEPDGVRDADLADVVQRGGEAQVLDGVVREAELAGEQGGGAADALGVLLRVVVAVLGGEREALERLLAGVLEVGGAGADPALEVVVAVLERALQAARLEEVADAQEDLHAVERLRDEVLGAQAERAAARGGRAVGGQDEGGHAGGDDALQGGEAVDARKLEVEDHEVGVVAVEDGVQLLGRRGGVDRLVAGRAEHAPEHECALGVLEDDDVLRAPVGIRHDRHGPRLVGRTPSEVEDGSSAPGRIASPRPTTRTHAWRRSR
jgi:hypothetical protein